MAATDASSSSSSAPTLPLTAPLDAPSTTALSAAPSTTVTTVPLAAPFVALPAAPPPPGSYTAAPPYSLWGTNALASIYTDALSMASAGSLSGFVAPSSTSGPITRPTQFGAGPSFVNAPSPNFANTSMLGIINIQSAITIRLSNENYLFWRAQVAPLLRSQILMGTATAPSPPPKHVGVMHTGDMILSQPNPAYQHWIQHDQSILSAFVSSMTEGVLGMVMFANSSREAWETLNGAFASTSIARSSGIRQQMAELKKHDQTINVYFHRMKALADSLASIGEPLHDAEFISYLLAGLDKDYDALYQVVNAHQGAMPIRDLCSLLRATEVRNSARYAAEASAHSFPAAHAAAYGAHAAYAAHGGGTRPPPPRAAYVPPYAHPPCQLCGIHSHPASRCYKRFNKDFLGLNNNGSSTEKQLAMAMMAAPPPGYAPGYSYAPPPAPVPAYTSAPAGAPAAPSHVVDPAWYADSGATHHITHELDKLTMSQPYYGADQEILAVLVWNFARPNIIRVTSITAPHVDHPAPMHGVALGCVPTGSASVG
ncbi:hypothetical protein QYE76_011857 [Lolium multiflorum]|uniref:Retrotransposon Copia-like N-terminal domain-containing protein n=1 Tax=Lolium multiflorum TaxID=4521 RepID=A0AAD8U003_LOLMU|nr:hypothetical protein QYE76_011857 [Lolium multiflorum]